MKSLNIGSALAPQRSDEPSFEQKEMAIRTWIANKESVCPYAPGLVKFVHLPDIDSMSMEHVHYLAKELKAFYEAKEKGKRVGRWILLPSQEWKDHDDAMKYSERFFWLMNAAYYFLMDDKKKLKASMLMELDGIERGFQGDINNPIIGKLPAQNSKVIPARSLFCSALGPLYRSQKFYRYNPYSAMVLVYLSEFAEKKRRHPNAARRIALDMAHSSLFEHYGDDINVAIDGLEKELPIWGAIIDKTAELLRSGKTKTPNSSNVGSPESNLQVFRNCPPQLAHAFYSKYLEYLPIMKLIVEGKHSHPKDVLNSCFAGTGIYTKPIYPKSYQQGFESSYQR